MSRFYPLFGAASVVIALSAGALSADYANGVDELRGPFPEDWGFSDEPDPLDFEIGLRYWYSLGSSQISAFGNTYSSSDTSQIGELHFRINDNSTSSFVKGNAGLAAIIQGSYTTPEFVGAQTMSGGTIAYAGADFGVMPFGNGAFQFGGFAGYQFLIDNPDMGRATFTTSGGGSDSVTNQTQINLLKLGAVAKAEIGEVFDISAEAAIIPYALMGGTFGAFYQANFLDGGLTFEQGSAGVMSGNLYGASAEVMIGFRPTENIVARVGGRAWYLTGDATLEFTAREVGTPGNEQSYIADISGLEFIRYGAVAELTGAF